MAFELLDFSDAPTREEILVDIEGHLASFTSYLATKAKSYSTIKQYVGIVKNALFASDLTSDAAWKEELAKYSPTSWPVRNSARRAYLYFLSGAPDPASVVVEDGRKPDSTGDPSKLLPVGRRKPANVITLAAKLSRPVEDRLRRYLRKYMELQEKQLIRKDVLEFAREFVDEYRMQISVEVAMEERERLEFDNVLVTQLPPKPDEVDALLDTLLRTKPEEEDLEDLEDLED